MDETRRFREHVLVNALVNLLGILKYHIQIVTCEVTCYVENKCFLNLIFITLFTLSVWIKFSVKNTGRAKLFLSLQYLFV